jgi:FlaA1/EpsC-like NDP-sugar epimerase
MALDPSDDLPSLRRLFSERTWPEGPSVPSEALRDCVVLVTGAGGSLGQRLVRRCARQPVAAVLAADTSEHALVQGQTAWAGPTAETTAEVVPVLADLRHGPDRRRCLRAGPTAAPDVVIHAAAYKHVPFLEDRPIAAAQNNLLATVDWAQACRDVGVGRFVFVSTDKAVVPTSTMGQTKRWAEQWLRAASDRAAPPTSIVRLCNLFGSRGSVVPKARRRLQAGEPVPVTHPGMRRWMMAPTDATRVVLRAASEQAASEPAARRATTVVPSACVEVSIPDLVRRLIHHVRPDWKEEVVSGLRPDREEEVVSGLRPDRREEVVSGPRPDANPTDWIEWTGPRPGERLQEPRWGRDERPEEASDAGDGLRRLVCPAPPARVDTALAPLRRACADGEGRAAERLLKQVTEEADPEKPVPRV